MVNLAISAAVLLVVNGMERRSGTGVRR
jgi:hypothetical protein